MIDVTNKTPLRVNKHGSANASIHLSVDQLPEVQKLFDDHAIRYWVSESYLSYNGSPFQAIIYLYHAMDTELVQSLLDGGG